MVNSTTQRCYTRYIEEMTLKRVPEVRFFPSHVERDLQKESIAKMLRTGWLENARCSHTLHGSKGG